MELRIEIDTQDFRATISINREIDTNRYEYRQESTTRRVHSQSFLLAKGSNGLRE